MIILAENIMWCIECYYYYSYINNTIEKTKELIIDLRQRIISKLKNSYSTISNQLAIQLVVQSVKKKV